MRTKTIQSVVIVVFIAMLSFVSPLLLCAAEYGGGRQEKALPYSEPTQLLELGYAPGEVIIKFSGTAKEAVREVFTAVFAQGPLENSWLHKAVDFNAHLTPSTIDTLKTKGVDLTLLREANAKYKAKIEPVLKALHRELQVQGTDFYNLEAKKKAKTKEEVSSLPDLSAIYLLKIEGDVQEAVEAYSQLKRKGIIEYAEPNYIYKTQMIPNDPYYSSSGSWGQDYGDLWGLEKINAGEAWDTAQGENIIVAVIDSGIDYSHDDIEINMWRNSGEVPGNGIDDDNNGYIDDYYGYDFHNEDGDPMDDHGHGTHCAGTIAAAGNNAEGIIGVAPRARVMAIKGLGLEGSGYTDDLVNSLYYAADMGADVISNSWGGPFSETIAEAVYYAYYGGSVVVAAAGNNNGDAADYSPAGVDCAVTVASVNHNDRKSGFSNWGIKIDVSAPGGDDSDGSTNQNYRNILSLRAANTDMYGDGISIVGTNYYRSRGTSMACPHVAGLAALVLSKNPSYTNEEVRDIICMGADDIEEPGFDIMSGYGRINALESLSLDSVPQITAEMTSPASNGLILIEAGKEIIFEGTAASSDFSYYRLEYRKVQDGFPWIEIRTSAAQVINGEMGRLDISDFDPSSYEFRLSVAISGSDYIKFVFTACLLCVRPESSISAVPGGTASTTPLFADLDGDGDMEVLVGGGDSGTKFIFAFHLDGTPVSGWPVLLAGDLISGIAASDIDNDGNYEVAAMSYGDTSAYTELFRGDGSIISGWPRIKQGMVNMFTLPSFYNIDGDAEEEIIIISYNPAYMRSTVFAWNMDGSEVFTPREILYSQQKAPSVGDIGGDGSPEIIIASGNFFAGIQACYILNADGTDKDGWPKEFYDSYDMPDSPLLVDLDNDEIPEIVTTSLHFGAQEAIYRIHAFKADGLELSGWPIEIIKMGFAHVINPKMIASDMDSDGTPEILFVTHEQSKDWIKIFSADGLPFPGCATIELPRDSADKNVLLTADLDRDGDVDIISASYSSSDAPDNVCTVSLIDNGQIREEILYPGNKFSIPILFDPDADGILDLGVFVIEEIGQEDVGSVVIQPLRAYDIKRPEWPINTHDPKNTGNYDYKTALIPDTTGPTLAITSHHFYDTIAYADFVFSGTADDESGIGEVRVYVYDSVRRSWTVDNEPAVYNADIKEWNFTVLREKVTAGAQTWLIVLARDKAGNWTFWGEKNSLVRVNIEGSCNHPPTAFNQPVGLNEDASKSITLTARDPEGGALTYNIVTGPANGTLSGVVPNLTYVPNANYYGEDHFTFKANDGEHDSNIATIFITVRPVNDAPIITVGPTANPAVIFENETSTISVIVLDIDGDNLTYSWSADAGVVSGTGAEVIYVPNDVSAQADNTINLTVSDANTGETSASVRVTVNPVDTTAPVGSIIINNNAAATRYPVNTLNLTASDAESGVFQMQFSNDGITWSVPEAYNAVKSWAFASPVQGVKTVYVKFSDNAGNWSSAYKDSIVFDTTAPVVGSINDFPDPFDPETGQLTKISCVATDNTPSLSFYVYVYIYNSAGTFVKSFSVISPNTYVYWNGKDSRGVLVPDGMYKYRLRAQDRAGNLSPYSAYYYVTKK